MQANVLSWPYCFYNDEANFKPLLTIFLPRICRQLDDPLLKFLQTFQLSIAVSSQHVRNHSDVRISEQYSHTI